jgi:hypothetical protein
MKLNGTIKRAKELAHRFQESYVIIKATNNEYDTFPSEFLRKRGVSQKYVVAEVSRWGKVNKY